MTKKSFEASVTVQATPVEVFRYIGDFVRHVEWNYQPQAMVPLTEGPTRVGSQYRTTEIPASTTPFMEKMVFSLIKPVMKLMLGTEFQTIAEITALEPERRLAWKAHLPSTKKGDLMRMGWEVELQPDNGTTKVIQRCEIDPPEGSPFARVVKNIGRFQAETAANLARLKSLVEARKG